MDYVNKNYVTMDYVNKKTVGTILCSILQLLHQSDSHNGAGLMDNVGILYACCINLSSSVAL